jgi:hypothetical protein
MSNESGLYAGAAVVTLLVLGMGGMLTERVQPALVDQGGLTITEQERMEKVASASLFGQFRTSLSDYLYLKADRYMHRGVELRGLTAQEKQSDSADKVSTNPNDPVKMQHHGETTVVPSRDHDWRGHIGDIEREVSPYMDMKGHTHADARQTLPLFRLMTWSNPHFIKGYVLGSTLIDADGHHTDQALAFLKEGEANNPQSFEIKTEIGYVYTRKKMDYPTGMTYLNQALDLLAQRDPQSLDEDEKDAQLNTYRWSVLNRREAGDYARGRQLANEGNKYFPDDVVFAGFLKKYGNSVSTGKTP